MTLNVWTGFVFATAEICVVVASACGGAKHSPSTHYRHSNFPMRIIAADKNEHEKEKRIVSFAPSGSAALESESAANFWLYVHRAVRCLAASPRTHTFTLAKQQKKMYYFQSVSRTTEWNVRRVCVSGGGVYCVFARTIFIFIFILILFIFALLVSATEHTILHFIQHFVFFLYSRRCCCCWVWCMLLCTLFTVNFISCCCSLHSAVRLVCVPLTEIV